MDAHMSKAISNMLQYMYYVASNFYVKFNIFNSKTQSPEEKTTLFSKPLSKTSGITLKSIAYS